MLILEMIKEALEGEGHSVTTLQSTNNIIDLVEKEQADLLILDYILDGVNGGELCRQLKKHATTAHIPVMICSGYSRVLNSLGFYDCNVFLEKPFDLADLTNQVSKLLNAAKTGSPA